MSAVEMKICGVRRTPFSFSGWQCSSAPERCSCPYAKTLPLFYFDLFLLWVLCNGVERFIAQCCIEQGSIKCSEKQMRSWPLPLVLSTIVVCVSSDHVVEKLHDGTKAIVGERLSPKSCRRKPADLDLAKTFTIKTEHFLTRFSVFQRLILGEFLTSLRRPFPDMQITSILVVA